MGQVENTQLIISQCLSEGAQAHLLEMVPLGSHSPLSQYPAKLQVHQSFDWRKSRFLSSLWLLSVYLLAVVKLRSLFYCLLLAVLSCQRPPLQYNVSF